MSEITHTELGRQLMKPTGSDGLKVAEKMNVTNQKLYDFVLEQLELNDDDSILEIGFGNGKTIPMFFAKNATIHYYGLDFSEIMCTEAIANTKDLGKSISITCEDAMHMSYSNDFFDSIVTLNTVYFWQDLTLQLAELKRILRKGGKLIIGYRPKSSMEKLPFTQEVFSHYESEELNKVILQNGFKIVKEATNATVVKSVDNGNINMLDICLITEKI
jgi:ubiquinone/menaquinone biosynthesis C-methylase UbiE